MALRVVADTNVYVSVLEFGGRVSEILEFAEDGTIELCISVAILDEVAGVLVRKFGWGPERVREAEETLADLCRIVRPQVAVRAAPDADDDAILECALEAGADVIVSGDRHLLGLGSFRGMRVMSPRQFLDWLQAGQ